ncbi:uncharacterized protein LOC113325011 [Papaver somniferum]|uniref:uncharacterized protein LOC113325011 n=1 Tax=Papaver somniferum TaxID=3469 RepID=UPI000E700A58|nr:uncharacterized protein LOC113325011 [Papaver somniferum]
MAEESGWWEDCHPLEFRRQFRINRSTFNLICDKIPPYTVTKRKATTKDLRRNVAACIWRLASGQPSSVMNEKFGLTRQQWHDSCRKFVKNIMMDKYVKWPDAVEMYRDIQLTKRGSGSYSTALQAVVNHKGIFQDVFIGGPGSLPDYAVYQSSTLCKEKVESLEGVWIVGNRKIPLVEKVLVPYTNYSNLTQTQRTFDTQLYEIESVAREVCLMLLNGADLLNLEVMKNAVLVCCILHNICETNDDWMDPEWRLNLEDNCYIPNPAVVSASASHKRDAIAESLAQKLAVNLEFHM